MCERYGYQQNITSKTEIHSNTNENQCENDCRKNDTNMKEKGANLDPKKGTRIQSNLNKWMPKTMQKFVTKNGHIA